MAPGRQFERDGKQDRERPRRADPGEDPHQRAKDSADKAEDEISG